MRMTKPLAIGSTVLLVFAASIALAGDEPKECLGTLVSVQGKISNNALGPGDTLGVVDLNLDKTPKNATKKMKCGLHGIAYFRDPDPADPLSALPRFTHRMVCDDTAAIPGTSLTIHSQAIFDTHFIEYVPGQFCGGSQFAFSFKEISYGQSGRGIFAPGGGGTIGIQGTFSCSGAIDMNFAGTACLSH
jgi:hypothetical protein